MKIKLLQDLPIDKNSGAFEGKIFEVSETRVFDRRNMAYFTGDDGSKCAAYGHEYEIVED
jgi:hypothetical protein